MCAWHCRFSIPTNNVTMLAFLLFDSCHSHLLVSFLVIVNEYS